MKIHSILAGFILLLCCISNSIIASEAAQWSYQYVITTTDSENRLAPIFNDIASDVTIYNEEFLDLIAEVLARSYKDPDYSRKNTTAMVNILLTNDNYRYASLIGEVKAVVRMFKIRGTVSRYLKASQGTEIKQYVPGSINLAKIRAAYINDALNMDLESIASESVLSQMKRGDTIDDLFKLAGKPQAVVSGVTRSNSPLFHRKFMRLSFIYRKQGRVIFDYHRRIGWYFRNVVLDPLLFEEFMPYRSQAEELGMLSDDGLLIASLLSGNALPIKAVAEDLFDNGGANIEILDSAAEILLNRFADSNDPAMVDAYSWVCKLLVKRGGRRYKKVLRYIAKNSRNKKLSRNARFIPRGRHHISKEEYSAGDISFEDLKKKYLSPYAMSE